MTSSKTHDLDKERRDLYAVSLTVIVFVLAGATLKEEFPTLLGAVKITRPEVILIGMGLAWAYFLWRYWLRIGEPLIEFADDVDAEILRSTRYANFCRALERQRLELSGAIDSNTLPRGERERNTNQRELMGKRLNDPTHFVYGFPERTYLKSFRVGAWRNRQGLGLDAFNNVIDERLPAAPAARDRWSIVLPAMVRAATRGRVFSDKLLPLFVAALAFILGMYRAIKWAWWALY